VAEHPHRQAALRVEFLQEARLARTELTADAEVVDLGDPPARRRRGRVRYDPEPVLTLRFGGMRYERAHRSYLPQETGGAARTVPDEAPFRRVGGLCRDARQFQRDTVRHGEMPGHVRDEDRLRRGDPVQKCAVRMLLLRQQGVVVAPAAAPAVDTAGCGEPL